MEDLLNIPTFLKRSAPAKPPARRKAKPRRKARPDGPPLPAGARKGMVYCSGRMAHRVGFGYRVLGFKPGRKWLHFYSAEGGALIHDKIPLSFWEALEEVIVWMED